ncbi:RrF2 family transcriptional regulator [Candidatus Margulisiibacteriota bacterium]
MIKLTTKSVYGVIALTELAKYYGKKHIQIGDISKKHNIPHNYLEQLMVRLKKAGFIKSIRGAKGGYELAKQPHTIMLYDIILFFEGKRDESQTKNKFPILNEYIYEAENEVRHVFSRSLQDMVNDMQKYRQQYTYHI